MKCQGCLIQSVAFHQGGVDGSMTNSAVSKHYKCATMTVKKKFVLSATANNNY
jgi:hypothetical protein